MNKQNNFDKVVSVSYQGAKQIINKLSSEEVAELYKDLNNHIQYLYAGVSDYDQIEYGHISNGPADNHAYIKNMKLTTKEFHKAFGKLKKLEIIMMYCFDKINSTAFAEVR